MPNTVAGSPVGAQQPPTSLNAAQQQPSSNLTNQQQLIQSLGQSQLPATAQSQLQYTLGQQQLGLVNQQFGQGVAYNNALAGYQQGGLGISAQQNALSGVGIGEQAATSAQQQGIEQQQFGLQSQQYPEQQQEAALNYQNALSGLSSSSAISGTLGTQGHAQQLGTLQQNYGFEQQDISRAQQLAGLGQQSEEAGYGLSQEQLGNAQANLGLIGKANNLSQQQVLTMLNYGNQQQALGAQQDVIGLLGQQAGLVTGTDSNLGATLSQIGFSGGINALAGG